MRASGLDLATDRDRHGPGRIRHGRGIPHRRVRATPAFPELTSPEASQPKNAVRIATLTAFSQTIPPHALPEQTNAETG
jgi:hypothetical protein